ncbi:MAG TPA: M20/M25/M40 family metallo-hydrolase [Blastocatellia bacterium]|nr:M20/M25/M40 family metallo-hydrolase [Blastocatellia bacterium]
MIRRSLAVLALLCAVTISGFTVGAQAPKPEDVHQDVIDKLKDAELNHSQVMDILSYLTDVYGPRLTGSPNALAAGNWAKEKLAEWGGQNVHMEKWGPFGRGWALQKFEASAVEPQAFPLIAYPKAWSPSTKGAVTGEVVYMDANTPEDLDKYKGKLKGAIVMISPLREVPAHFKADGHRLTDEELLALADAEPPVAGGGRGGGRPGGPGGGPSLQQQIAQKKMEMVYDEGAAVILDAGRGDGGTMFVQSAAVKPYPQDVPRDQRKSAYSLDAPAIIPQVTVSVEQYNRMVRMIQRGVHVQVEVNLVARYYDNDPNSFNIIAEIPGTDLKDEVVMLGAHFDSWHSGTGATDNAAGSAVCMEAFRLIQSLGLKPRRTIRIGLWTGEEEGLLGSRAYVAQHFGDREMVNGQPGELKLKPEQEKVAGYFNLDNGTGKIRGIYLQGNEAVRPIFRAWLAPFKDLGASTITPSNTGGTDHLSFDGVGIPGFQFIQDEIEYSSRTHHSNQDVYDRIQADDMKQSSLIMASFVYNTAMRDEKLPRKPLQTGGGQRRGQ